MQAEKPWKRFDVPRTWQTGWMTGLTATHVSACLLLDPVSDPRSDFIHAVAHATEQAVLLRIFNSISESYRAPVSFRASELPWWLGRKRFRVGMHCAQSCATVIPSLAYVRRHTHTSEKCATTIDRICKCTLDGADRSGQWMFFARTHYYSSPPFQPFTVSPTSSMCTHTLLAHADKYAHDLHVPRGGDGAPANPWRGCSKSCRRCTM